jgi:hypothetical protein
MEFVVKDSRTSNKLIAPPRSPRLPAPRKVTRICGNLATAKSLHINRGMWASSGSGRIQSAARGGGKLARRNPRWRHCQFWTSRTAQSRTAIDRIFLPCHLSDFHAAGEAVHVAGSCFDFCSNRHEVGTSRRRSSAERQASSVSQSVTRSHSRPIF